MRQIERAVLFDLDGTLVDSHKIIVQSFDEALNFFGIHQATEAIEATIGKPLPASYRELTQQEDIEKFCLKHDEIQRELLPTIEAFPGVVEVLEEIRSSGLRMAVVTARTSGTRTILDAIGVKAMIENLVTGNDVSHHKPDPEGINKVLAEMKIRPDKAIMVGDTPPDIGAGKNAGVLTVGATYGSWGQKIAESNPDYVINSFWKLREIVIREIK